MPKPYFLGLSAGTGAHCPSFVREALGFRSALELNCFLSFVSFVSRHSFSGTHRRNLFFGEMCLINHLIPW